MELTGALICIGLAAIIAACLGMYQWGRASAQRDLARLKEKMQQKAVEAVVRPAPRGSELSDALGLPDEAELLSADERR